jgi:hypothetical protein
MFRYAIVALALVGVLTLTGPAAARTASSPLDGLTLTIPVAQTSLFSETVVDGSCSVPAVHIVLRNGNLDGTAPLGGSGWSAVPHALLSDLDVVTIGNQIVSLNLNMQLVNGTQQRLLRIAAGSNTSCVPIGSVIANWTAPAVPLSSPDPGWTGSAHLNVPALGGTLTVTLDRPVAPPVWTSQPSLHGQPVVGQQMSVNASPPTGATVGYQWQRSLNGTAWSDIGDASAQSYMITSTDKGKRLRAVVTATTSAGKAAAATASTRPVVAAPPLPTDASVTRYSNEAPQADAVLGLDIYSYLFVDLKQYAYWKNQYSIAFASHLFDGLRYSLAARHPGWWSQHHAEFDVLLTEAKAQCHGQIMSYVHDSSGHAITCDPSRLDDLKAFALTDLGEQVGRFQPVSVYTDWTNKATWADITKITHAFGCDAQILIDKGLQAGLGFVTGQAIDLAVTNVFLNWLVKRGTNTLLGDVFRPIPGCHLSLP